MRTVVPFTTDCASAVWPLSYHATPKLHLCFVSLSPVSNPQIHQNPRRPDRRPGGSGLFCVPGCRWPTAQDRLEQKRQKSQQPEIRGTWKLCIFAFSGRFVLVLNSESSCVSEKAGKKRFPCERKIGFWFQHWGQAESKTKDSHTNLSVFYIFRQISFQRRPWPDSLTYLSHRGESQRSLRQTLFHLPQNCSESWDRSQ